MSNKLSNLESKNLSLSVDIWSDKFNLNSFVDFNVIYIEDFIIKSFQFDMKHFPVAHTALNIENTISQFANSFNIEPLRVISDSASNMVSGLKKFEHYRCAAHRLNTIISNGNIQLI